MRCETTSLECLVEYLLDGTEYVITVVPSYDLGWDGVTGGKVFPRNIIFHMK